MAKTTKKQDEYLAKMYHPSYKEPSVDEFNKKFNNAKITNVRVDRSTTEIVIETSKGDMILGCEMDNGDAVIVRGFMK